MKAYQAYGKPGRVTSEQSPYHAAAAYFAKFPKSTKCNIVAGEHDGYFFTVAYGRKSAGEWPESYRDVTKKSMHTVRGAE